MNTNRIKSIIKRVIKQPNYVKIQILLFLSRFIPDRQFLELIFPLRTGYKLDLDNPKTYNEKLQWLKLYDHQVKYTRMVDKIEAKNYVADIIGEGHIIPTLAVYNRVDDIDFDLLPNQFVLKCTHDSGGIIVCKDKGKLDKKAVIKTLKKGLKKNYYYHNREWPYKNVTPRIIAEKYMEDETGELRDYKFFCFNGEPKAMFVASDRYNKNEETKFDFYDMEFNHLPFTNGHPNSNKQIKMPKGFEEMKSIAAKLSIGIPQVRVDLYDIDGAIYFGEITFFHWSGMKPFEPIDWDYTFGDWICLTDKQ